MFRVFLFEFSANRTSESEVLRLLYAGASPRAPACTSADLRPSVLPLWRPLPVSAPHCSSPGPRVHAVCARIRFVRTSARTRPSAATSSSPAAGACSPPAASSFRALSLSPLVVGLPPRAAVVAHADGPRQPPSPARARREHRQRRHTSQATRTRGAIAGTGSERERARRTETTAVQRHHQRESPHELAAHTR
jgi:hypothetical protein